MNTVMDGAAWVGSGLLILSMAQRNGFRLRALNLAATALLTIYNWWFGSWPMTVLNGVLVIINIAFLIQMFRARASQTPDEAGGAPTDVASTLTQT